MSTNVYTGTSSLAERVHMQSLIYKTLMKRIAQNTRCGLPGIIKSFDPVKQYASVQLAIMENPRLPDGTKLPVELPLLDDVLVLFPGDHDWCLTFPNLIGCECYVCFADMCVNAWATNGFATDSNGKTIGRKQELEHRHDLSDGFAILAPRSQPLTIPNFSTSALQLRNMAGNVAISMTATQIQINMQGQSITISPSGIVVQGNLTVNGTLTTTGNATINGKSFAAHVHSGVQSGGSNTGPLV